MSGMMTNNKGTAAVVTTPAIAARIMQIAQIHGKQACLESYHAIQNLLEEHQDAGPLDELGDRSTRDCLIDLSMIAFYCAELAK